MCMFKGLTFLKITNHPTPRISKQGVRKNEAALLYGLGVLVILVILTLFGLCVQVGTDHEQAPFVG